MENRPIIKGKDTMVETEFYEWLKIMDSIGSKQTHFVKAVKSYMRDEAPFRGRKDLQAHKYVFEAYWRDSNFNKVLI